MRLPLFIAGLWIMTLATPQSKGVQFNVSDMALDLTEAFTFHKYPTYDQYLQMMQSYADRYPGLCRLDTFGTSEEGRLLLALKISDNPGEDEAEANFLYTSSMHGNELVGFVLLLRMADTLLSAYDTDPEIANVVNNLAIWINPLANPDGSFSRGKDTSLVKSVRENSDGIDLNRDFPDPDMADSDDTTGRAKETRDMMLFLKEHNFTLSANIHSGAEVVNYPWDYDSASHADDAWYNFISREYTDEATAVDSDYMAYWEYGITHGAYWYVANGTRQDYVNYYLEGREVTLELSNDKLLSSEFLEEFWAKNHRSLLNYISQCTYGIRGRITDRLTGQPVRASIFIPDHDSFYSMVHSSDDHGDYYRLIKEGVYDLVISAEGYITDTLLSVQVNDHNSITLNVELEQDPFAGLSPDSPGPAFNIYPNPATTNLYIDATGTHAGPVHIRILSVDGQQHLHRVFHPSGHPFQLSLDHLPGGLYLLNISNGATSESFKFIRQR